MNKNMINSKIAKDCILKMLRSPANWVVIAMTYIIWSLVGMRYSTNQNFNMVTAQQNYVMAMSLVSVIIAAFNHNTKLVNLGLIGATTLVISFITVATSQVGVILYGYPIGYYLFCPITIFLFLQQIKQICIFSYCKYCELLKRSGVDQNE